MTSSSGESGAMGATSATKSTTDDDALGGIWLLLAPEVGWALFGIFAAIVHAAVYAELAVPSLAIVLGACAVIGIVAAILVARERPRRLSAWFADAFADTRIVDVTQPPMSRVDSALVLLGILSAGALYAGSHHTEWLQPATALCFVVGAVAWARGGGRRLEEAATALSTREVAVAAALALAALIYALLANRFDSDDGFYVNAAQALADHPESPVLQRDFMLDVGRLPILMPIYKTHAHEVAVGLFAWVTGMPALHVMHVLSVALCAPLVPLAWARLFRTVIGRQWIVAAVVVTALLLLDGTRDSNESKEFLRIYQGKSVWLCIGVPVLIGAALRFSLTPSWPRFAVLLLAQAAAIGATSSAMWAAPLVTALVVASVASGDLRARIRTIAWSCASSVEVVVVAFWLRGELRASGAVVAKLTVGANDTVVSALDYVYADGAYRAAWLMLLMAAPFFSASSVARRTLSALLLGFFAMFQPLTAPFVAAALTGAGTFPRVFWLLPTPLFVGVAVAAIWPRTDDGRTRIRVKIGAFAIACTIFLGVLPTGPTCSAKDSCRFEAGPKVSTKTYPLALWVAQNVSEDAFVLVPQREGWNAVMFPHPPHPLVVKWHYFQMQPNDIDADDADVRTRLVRYVEGLPVEPPMSPILFGTALSRYRIEAVLYTEGAPVAAMSERWLPDYGFHRVGTQDKHTLWVRPAFETEPAHEDTVGDAFAPPTVH